MEALQKYIFAHRYYSTFKGGYNLHPPKIERGSIWIDFQELSHGHIVADEASPSLYINWETPRPIEAWSPGGHIVDDFYGASFGNLPSWTTRSRIPLLRIPGLNKRWNNVFGNDAALC